MNTVTIAVPKRWEPAILEIKRFVEHCAEMHSVHFSVILTYQLDVGQIYITDDTLTEFERQVCQNAISAISDQLNANLSKNARSARSGPLPWGGPAVVLANEEV